MRLLAAFVLLAVLHAACSVSIGHGRRELLRDRLRGQRHEEDPFGAMEQLKKVMSKMQTKLNSLHSMAVNGTRVKGLANITGAKAKVNDLKELELRELVQQQVKRFTDEAVEKLKIEKTKMKNHIDTLFSEIRRQAVEAVGAAPLVQSANTSQTNRTLMQLARFKEDVINEGDTEGLHAARLKPEVMDVEPIVGVSQEELRAATDAAAQVVDELNADAEKQTTPDFRFKSVSPAGMVAATILQGTPKGLGSMGVSVVPKIVEPEAAATTNTGAPVPVAAAVKAGPADATVKKLTTKQVKQLNEEQEMAKKEIEALDRIRKKMHDAEIEATKQRIAALEKRLSANLDASTEDTSIEKIQEEITESSKAPKLPDTVRVATGPEKLPKKGAPDTLADSMEKAIADAQQKAAALKALAAKNKGTGSVKRAKRSKKNKRAKRTKKTTLAKRRRRSKRRRAGSA